MNSCKREQSDVVTKLCTNGRIANKEVHNWMHCEQGRLTLQVIEKVQ